MTVLFLCVANSARSQIAEGLARKYFPPSIRVLSAGSRPTQVNPLAIQVMKEVGIDISSHHSKSANEINPDEIDLVITLCEEEVCPTFLGKAKKLHWPFPDPGGTLEKFREARTSIEAKLKEFVSNM